MELETSRTWAEIKVDRLRHNISSLKSYLQPHTRLMCTVKAEAYGHGIRAAEIFAESGADYLAVATLDEAILLRSHGIALPVLILGYVQEPFLTEAIAGGATLTVFSLDYAQKVSEAAVKLGKKARIHIKIDTGMGRIGYVYTERGNQKAAEEIAAMFSLPALEIEGIYTHMSCSDEEQNPYNFVQINRFYKALADLEARNLSVPLRHICNSSAIVNFPQVHLDMVRAGIACYGLYPSPVMKKKLNLKQALTLKTRITYIKELEAGSGISYGKTVTLAEKRRIATVPIGYADGYTRLLSGKAQMIAHGQYVDVIGKICMDQCMIDVTNVHTIHVGDEVTVIGDEHTHISADHLAELIGTINYEVVCAIGKRVPRIYI